MSNSNSFKDLPVGGIFYFRLPENGGGSITEVNGIKCEATRWRKTSEWEIVPVDKDGVYTGGQKWTLGFKVNQPILVVGGNRVS